MTNPEPNNPSLTIHAPIALVALSLCVLSLAEIIGIRTATETEIAALEWQSVAADKQIAALKESSAKLAETIEARKALIAQSEATQKQFTEVMKDLSALARAGDQDAKNIIGF